MKSFSSKYSLIPVIQEQDSVSEYIGLRPRTKYSHSSQKLSAQQGMMTASRTSSLQMLQVSSGGMVSFSGSTTGAITLRLDESAATLEDTRNDMNTIILALTGLLCVQQHCQIGPP